MPSYREILENKFREEYKKLNEHQQRAVDTIEGPVMVIAGPGTGKTQILAARIGKILLETDATPHNILCLTYTDAGTIAMRKRLIEFIGPDAYKIAIHTFHSFCNEVIQSNLALFQKKSLEPVSELESIQLLRNLIDTLPKNHPLKRYHGDVYYEASHLKELFSAMKREGWTPEFLNKCIDESIESLSTHVDFIAKKAVGPYKKGDVRTDWVAKAAEKFERTRAAVNQFERFNKLMSEKDRYDFDDMINWVIHEFELNKDLLANYQEQFQYVLVDEYQDTSGSQNKLVSLLINYWDKPNVFVVGDDDQSIFRFQGANVENMLDFRDNYARQIETVVLNHNYRSSQPILDLSGQLIERNQERLIRKIEGLSKDLISAGDEVKDIKAPPVINQYHSLRDEMAGITFAIRQLISGGVAPGNIAVIYSKHKVGMELARYLQLSGIPMFSRRHLDLFTEPFALKIFTLLRYLSEEHDIPYSGDENLFKILHFDFYGIKPLDIAKLSVAAAGREKDNSLRKVLVEKAARNPVDLFGRAADEKILRFADMIESLIADVANVPLQQLFENIITKAGILKYVMEQDMRHYLMKVLTAIFDFIKEETARRPDLDIHGLMETMELMQKERIPLSMVQVSGTEKGVNMLSAHGAKGLEFDHVFVVGLVSKMWESHQGPRGGYSIPENVFKISASHSDEEELRRLFYVALTRAKKELVISFARFDNKGKEWEPSKFIAELREKSNVMFREVSIDEEHRFEFQALQFTAQAPEIQKAEEDFIGPILDRFSLSVTALNNYLDCPLSFYFKNIVRIPSGKHESFVFGSAVHFALEQIFRKMLDSREKSGKEIFPSREDALDFFRWYMNKHRENFTRQSFARKLEHGEQILPVYYDTYVSTWNKVVLVELNISGVVVNGVPIKGKLDKLEFNGKEVNVVDYKTGSPDNARAKLDPPGEKNPNGGDYWRQAVFYKLLVDNYKEKGWRAVSTEFDFVEPDKSKKIGKKIIPVTDADLTTVKEQINTVWSRIQARDFYTGCGKDTCEWCRFVKDNHIAIALHELQEEEA